MNDLKFAIRQLLKNAGFTAVAVLTLALGIGASSTVFGLVFHLLIRPPAFTKDVERLRFVWERRPDSAPGELLRVDFRNYEHLKQHADIFEEVGAYQSGGRHLVHAGQKVLDTDGQCVSYVLLPTLGVAPVLGRNFLKEEDTPGAAPVVILGHHLWKEHFAGDPEIVGKSIRANDGWETVVGVLPPDFRPPGWPERSDFLKPLQIGAEAPRDRESRLYVVGRLKPSSTSEQFNSWLALTSADLRGQPWNAQDLSFESSSVREETVRRVRPLLLVFSGAVALVLIIACSNTAILLLLRGSAREKEFAIRSALGAGRMQLIRQTFFESLLLSAAAGVLGLLMADWSCTMFSGLSPYFGDLPRVGEVAITWQVMAFTMGLCAFISILVATVPAIRQSSQTSARSLVDRSSGSTLTSNRYRSALMAGQFALVLVLLVGAGLMTRTVVSLLKVDPGFATRHLYFLDIDLDTQRYARNDISGFYRRLLPDIRALPGIEAAGLVQYRPLLSKASYAVAIENMPPPADNVYPRVEYRPISDGYIETVGIPLLQGRTLTPEDIRADAPVALVDQAMAVRFWKDKQVVGKRLTVDGKNWLTVVGVVGNTRPHLDEAPAPTLYTPHPGNERWPNWMTLVVRSSVPPTSLIPALREQVRRADPNLPVAEVLTIERIIFQKTLWRRLLMAVLQFFAIATVLIAAVGIYGIVAQSVSQRRREIGVRIAVGATRGSVVFLFLKKCGWILITGLTIGMAGSIALAGFLKSWLYEITPLDLPTLAFASLVLSIAMLAATFIPARRAAKIDPMDALRNE
ncbi:FtsX-like permease family protein [bacterium]|nr:FtsX-like permease family protein [bacterium]